MRLQNRHNNLFVKWCVYDKERREKTIQFPQNSIYNHTHHLKNN